MLLFMAFWLLFVIYPFFIQLFILVITIKKNSVSAMSVTNGYDTSESGCTLCVDNPFKASSNIQQRRCHLYKQLKETWKIENGHDLFYFFPTWTFKRISITERANECSHYLMTKTKKYPLARYKYGYNVIEMWNLN